MTIRFSREEVRGFTNHINEVLQGEPSLQGSLPMNPESTDLFKVLRCRRRSPCVLLPDGRSQVVSRGVLLCKFVNKVAANTIPEHKVPDPLCRSPEQLTRPTLRST